METTFSAAVGAIYDAALEPWRWPNALQLIADCSDDVGAILIYERDDGSFGVIESQRLNAIVAEYREKWSHRDIRANRSKERGYFLDRDVITDRDVVTQHEVDTDPFYTDLLRRHDLKYFAATMVSPDPRVSVGISVQRQRDRPEYTDDELALLGRLGVHAERSLRLSMQLMDTELVKVGLGEALARIGVGVFVLDSLGRVVFSNPSADSLLGDGINIVDGKIVLGQVSLEGEGLFSNAMGAALNRKLGSAAEHGKPIMVERRRSNRPLAIYPLPIADTLTTAHRFLTHARTIVLVVDLDSADLLDPALIRDAFGLTLSEARVAALIGSGKAPRDAAAKLGIAEETVRSSLKRVFNKVGVSRQSELAALLAKLTYRPAG